MMKTPSNQNEDMLQKFYKTIDLSFSITFRSCQSRDCIPLKLLLPKPRNKMKALTFLRFLCIVVLFFIYNTKELIQNVNQVIQNRFNKSSNKYSIFLNTGVVVILWLLDLDL